MAKFIGIYNNKGGVGKTTLSLFFSDILASIRINGKKSRVLVVDFDPQASCSNAILGLEKVTDLKSGKLTLACGLHEKLNLNVDVKLEKYTFTRKKKSGLKTRKSLLGDIDVIASDFDSVASLDEILSLDDALGLAAWMRKELQDKYDFIFIDLPGNLSKRNGYSLIGTFLVDYFIVPIEPNRLNINAVPTTLKMLRNIAEWRGGNKAKLLGFLLNKADKRTSQYKLHKDELIQFAVIEDSKVYKNILPSAPILSSATDDTLQNYTLSDRYDGYYVKVKAVILEVLLDLGFEAKAKKG